MSTSRAGHRMVVREDNADRRLSPIGERLGLIGNEAANRIRERGERVAAEIVRLRTASVAADDEVNALLAGSGSSPLREAARALELLRRPELSYADVIRLARLESALDFDEAAELATEVKYE